MEEEENQGASGSGGGERDQAQVDPGNHLSTNAVLCFELMYGVSLSGDAYMRQLTEGYDRLAEVRLNEEYSECT